MAFSTRRGSGVSRVVNDDEEAVETILQRGLAEDVEGDCWAKGGGVAAITR